MKKIILSAAIVCACFGTSFAQTVSASHNPQYSIQILDFITLVPAGSPGIVQTVTFNNPSQSVTGLPVAPITYTVTASRSWKAFHSSTVFNRSGSATGIANTIPQTALTITSAAGPSSITVPTAATLTPATQVIQSGNGTTGTNFTLNGTLTPGLGGPGVQYSGTYTNTSTVVAALD